MKICLVLSVPIGIFGAIVTVFDVFNRSIGKRHPGFADIVFGLPLLSVLYAGLAWLGLMILPFFLHLAFSGPGRAMPEPGKLRRHD